jgi:hypothetical protein
MLIGLAPSAWSAEPVAMRIASFTLAPAHTPSAVVMVRSTSNSPFQGKLRLRGPEGWIIVPSEIDVTVAAGVTVRAAFTVQRGTIAEANSYPLEATLTAVGTTIVHKQNVVSASAPYFRPKIDGKIDDWKDAIPVTFLTGGKKTVISTYWNRKQFAFLIAVEEDNLVPWRADVPNEPCDAIQVAISPDDKPTATSPDQPAGRYEFLLAATGSPKDDRCPVKYFQLADPATKLGATQASRDLASLATDQIEAVVIRKEKTTYYECAIPLKSLPELKAGEGREFCLSFLVHDPDGTGIRDWGQAAGLWPSDRNRLAWSVWPGARWGQEPPFDNKTPWGMCSSKY